MNPAGRPGHRTPKQHRLPIFSLITACVTLLAGIGIWTSISPRAGSADDGTAAPVSVFTLVSTGIVFVDARTSEIVWRSSGKEEKVIGEDPWRNPELARPSDQTGVPAWREDRDIVGNPEYDLVSWVETVSGRRGGLVVVEASTGTVLARAPIAAPRDRSVVLASVDDERVYFATPDPATGFSDVPGASIRIWNWAAGENPRYIGIHQTNRFYNDVSAGTWAVYNHGVDFEDRDRHVLGAARYSAAGRTDFGSALSPDGTYWYGVETSQIVETATSRTITLPYAFNRNYGWTGLAELTLTSPLMVCSATTGTCGAPAGVPPGGICTFYGVVCGNSLPVN